MYFANCRTASCSNCSEQSRHQTKSKLPLKKWQQIACSVLHTRRCQRFGVWSDLHTRTWQTFWFKKCRQTSFSNLNTRQWQKLCEKIPTTPLEFLNSQTWSGMLPHDQERRRRLKWPEMLPSEEEESGAAKFGRPSTARNGLQAHGQKGPAKFPKKRFDADPRYENNPMFDPSPSVLHSYRRKSVPTIPHASLPESA